LEENSKKDLTDVGAEEVDGSGSGSRPVAGFAMLLKL